MEKEFKNIKFFELSISFEDEVIERIKKIRRRKKRAKMLVLPAVLIVILSLGLLMLLDFRSEREKVGLESLTMIEPSQKMPENIYLEVIPIKNFEKENRYLIEFVSENEEKIYAF